MNWFISGNYKVNLDHVVDVDRFDEMTVVVTLVTGREAVFTGDDAARLWDRLGGMYECGPTEADRAAAVEAFHRLTGDAGHATQRTPVEALREPCEIVQAFWSSSPA